MLLKSSRLVCLVSVFLLFTLMGPCSAFSLIGDLNHDGKVDIYDAEAVIETFGSKPGDEYWNPFADVLSDGQIDIFDVVRMAGMFGMCLPVASFVKSADVVNVGTPVAFDPSGSYDLDGVIVLYEWDWDNDGIYEHSTNLSETLTHIYMEPGTFNVTLKVTDNHELPDTDTRSVTVTLNNVVPEVPLGTVLATAAMILALVGYVTIPKFRKGKNGIKNPIV